MTNNEIKNFFENPDLMRDFHALSKTEFFEKNPTVTTEEYEATVDRIHDNILKGVQIERIEAIDVKLRKPFSDFFIRITKTNDKIDDRTGYMFMLMSDGCMHVSRWCGGYFKSEKEALVHATYIENYEIMQYIEEADLIAEHYENKFNE